jgi:hypothetical protein
MKVEEYDGNDLPSTSNQEKPINDSVTNEMLKSLQEQIEFLKSKLNSGTVKEETSDTKLLRELVSQLKNGSNDGSYDFRERYISDFEIDPEDELPKDKWVTFIANTVSYVIVDDKRKGKAVRVPYSPINFQYDSTRKINNGKETEVVNLSRYTCKSKKELEFMRSHTNYGIFFFENMQNRPDAKRTMKMLSIHGALKSMGMHELMPYAQRFNLDVTQDISVLRVQIANAYVDEQLDHEEKQNELRVNEAYIEKQIIKKL